MARLSVAEMRPSISVGYSSFMLSGDAVVTCGTRKESAAREERHGSHPNEKHKDHTAVLEFDNWDML